MSTHSNAKPHLAKILDRFDAFNEFFASLSERGDRYAARGVKFITFGFTIVVLIAALDLRLTMVFDYDDAGNTFTLHGERLVASLLFCAGVAYLLVGLSDRHPTEQTDGSGDGLGR